MQFEQSSRRRWLYLCGVAWTAGLAGCAAIEDDEPEETPEPTPEPTPTPEANGTPVENGRIDVTVDPSAEAITYGEGYTVAVTIQNMGNDVEFLPGSFVARAEAATWRHLKHGENIQIPPGEEVTETYTLIPPAIGDVEFGYMNAGTQVVLTQWNLSVAAPRVPFGETNSFYDGLDVTVDLRFTDAMEMPVKHTIEDDPGPRQITAPAGRQWVLLDLRVENTNETDSVRFDQAGRRAGVFLRANGIQQDQYDRQLWGTDGEFEDQLSPNEFVEVTEMSGYFDPPSELGPGGATEGWLLFTAPEDATDETLEVAMTRFEESAWDDVLMHWNGG